jgi:hypothetical protein
MCTWGWCAFMHTDILLFILAVMLVAMCRVYVYYLTMRLSWTLRTEEQLSLYI